MKRDKQNSINLGLIESTDNIYDVEGYIFDNLKETKWDNIKVKAFESIYNVCVCHYKNGEKGYLFLDDPDYFRIAKNININLYITNKDIPMYFLLAVLDVCKFEELSIDIIF